MKQSHKMNEYKYVQHELASANDQAELMNQTPQHNGMWVRRDALRVIDLSRKSMQPRKRNISFVNFV